MKSEKKELEIQEDLLEVKLGVCGCADEELVSDLLIVLKETSNKEFYITDICKRTKLSYKYVLALLFLLDNVNLIEHGTAIRASWITSEGEKVLEETK